MPISNGIQRDQSDYQYSSTKKAKCLLRNQKLNEKQCLSVILLQRFSTSKSMIYNNSFKLVFGHIYNLLRSKAKGTKNLVSVFIFIALNEAAVD